MKKSITVFFVAIFTIIILSTSVWADVINAKHITNEDGKGYWHTLDGEKIEGLFEFEYDNGQKSMMHFDENGYYKNYTGIAKARKSGKTFYYYNGKKSTGWRKIKNSWYHFDENGVMQTGRVKIADGTYIFDDDGKWTGKLTKSSKCPDDFSFYFSGFIQVDTDGKYINKPYVSENGKTVFSISKRDLQVIYSALREYDMNNLCNLGYDFVPEKLTYPKDFEVSSQEPDFDYVTKYVINGTNYSLKGTESAFISSNRQGNAYSQSYYEFVQFISRYLEQTKEYKTLPENDIFLE